MVEKPLSAGAEPDFARTTDMLMLVLGDGGRERATGEYEALFARAGLRLQRRTTLLHTLSGARADTLILADSPARRA